MGGNAWVSGLTEAKYTTVASNLVVKIRDTRFRASRHESVSTDEGAVFEMWSESDNLHVLLKKNVVNDQLSGILYPKI